MFMKKIFAVSFILVISFIFSLAVLAAENNNTNQSGEVVVEEEVKASDLGVTEPKVLPNSPWYWAKSLWRSMKLWATLDPLKKAEARLQIANEKLLELKKLAEAGKISDEQLERILSKYDKEIEKLKARMEKFKEKSGAKVDEFLDKFTKQEFLRQRLMERLKEKVKPEVMEKFRQRSLERLGEVLETARAGGNKIEDRINNFFAELDPLKDKNLHNLEVLTQLLEKAPTQAQEAILRARSNALKRLGESFRQLSVDERQTKIEEILSQSTNASTTAGILEESTQAATSTPQLKKQIQEIKARILNKLKGR